MPKDHSGTFVALRAILAQHESGTGVGRDAPAAFTPVSRRPARALSSRGRTSHSPKL
jgi:hypothetical protein